jgi:hypothetical protein
MARVLDDPVLGQAIDGSPSLGLGEGFGPLLSPGEQAVLAQAPKLGAGRTSPVQDAIGKVWNGPNTALGAIYGGLGMGAGEIAHIFAGAPEPKVFLRDNALQFTNNPFGGVGAITLGNTTTWKGDPYDPSDKEWHDHRVPRLEPHPADRPGHTYPQHETEHTYQGEQLGPLYLPSNLVGGLNAMFNGEDWHGSHNWNEIGPSSNPPSAWPKVTP